MRLRLLATLLPLLLLAAGLNAQLIPAAELSSVERLQLGLGSDGSFVDAVLFEHGWRQAFPKERCRILRLDKEEGSPDPVTDAAAVYAKDGRLLVRCSAFGCFTLPGQDASLLENPVRLRQLVVQERAKLSRLPEPEEKALEQIQIAAARIRSQSSLRDFPIAVGKLPVVVMRDQERVKTELEYLIFYTSTQHHVYRPGTGGVAASPLPKHKSLGYTQPRVRGGDLIDALLYLQALRGKEPGIKARLSGIGLETKPNTRGLACVLFQRGGELRIHHLYMGEFPLGKVPVAEFDNEAAICQLLRSAYLSVYKRIQASREGASPKVTAVRMQYDDIMSFFSLAGTMSLPGDSDALQLLRASEALRRAGVTDLKATDTGVLLFSFEGKRFSYSPAKGSGLLPPQKVLPDLVSQASPGEPAAPQDKRRSGMATRYVPSQSELETLAAKADAGDTNACRELGTYLMEGNGVRKDSQKAILYLAKAAELGEGESAFMLARHFDAPGKASDNQEKARHYYQLAAQASFPLAMYNYGAMLFSGRGGKRELVEGLAWLIVSGRFGAEGPGESDARRDLAKLESTLHAAESRAEEILLGFPDRAPLKAPKTIFTPPPRPKVDLSH